jgi:hypothetical protein
MERMGILRKRVKGLDKVSPLGPGRVQSHFWGGIPNGASHIAEQWF